MGHEIVVVLQSNGIVIDLNLISGLGGQVCPVCRSCRGDTAEIGYVRGEVRVYRAAYVHRIILRVIHHVHKYI